MYFTIKKKTLLRASFEFIFCYCHQSYYHYYYPVQYHATPQLLIKGALYRLSCMILNHDIS